MLDALRQPLLESYPLLSWLALADILLVAFLIYQLLMIVRGRRAAHVLTGVLILTVVYFVANLLGFELLRLLLAALAPYAPFALIVMFQSEIRRWLSRIGRRRWFSFSNPLQQREFFEDIVLALRQLSATRTGALIVIERDIGLRTFVESGVGLDAALSRELLLTIFQNGSALHDGAVIVRQGKIAAAGCFLPLSTRPTIASKLGTRHRAAIGVTEETDSLALIVSEETGRISVAAFGDIDFDITPEQVRERMQVHLTQRAEPPPDSPLTSGSPQPLARTSGSEGLE
jgi:diadenylate cyclase